MCPTCSHILKEVSKRLTPTLRISTALKSDLVPVKDKIKITAMMRTAHDIADMYAESEDMVKVGSNKCSHCGQYGSSRSVCNYCGAPID